jgi:type I restriction enzyme S subunit
LGEVAEFSKGSGYSKGDLTDVGTPIILYGRLYTKYETVMEDIDTFVKMKNKSVMSSGGEVIIPSSGETAEDISRASVVGNAGVILGGDLNIVKPNSTIDPVFLAITISNGNQQKELRKRAQGKSVVHINNSDLKDIDLQLPTLTEQTTIGNFFRNLDTTITLHKRKLDGLKELKQAYLQQMFPQSGERVPRLRLDGFVWDWQEQKLGDVLKVNSGRDYKHLRDGDVPVYGTGGYMLSVDESLSDIDAIGIGRKGTIDKPQLLSAPFWTVDTLFFLTPFQNNDLLFLYALAQNIEWAKMDESTGVPSLSKVNIEKIDICIPCADEQTTIGSFFCKLDEQIVTQAHKLEQLKRLKAAYLQKIFI